ncbi:MAG TPA: NAD(P)-dependent oxidoreductase [Stellaceae bacterium]|nr:NAD(P)-dependent oxidoreductase [Stellaceae bacterium]
MLPLTLDLTRIPVLLIGEGEKALARLRALDEAGAADLRVHSETPSKILAEKAGARLRRHLPSAGEWRAARLVFIADEAALPRHRLARQARENGVLVHCEDDPESSDLHAPAVLRRGALTLAISTTGRAPALSGVIKRFLGTLFGPEWSSYLEELATLRRDWREGGANPALIADRTEAWFNRH